MKKEPDLFDFAEDGEQVDQNQCTHREEERTQTVWEGENFERLTMTCTKCGRIRGRWPGE